MEWLAFVTNHVVDSAQRRTVEQCLGCRDAKSSPLLHFHHQLGLYDQIACFFEQSKSEVVSELDRIIQTYKHIVLHHDQRQIDADLQAVMIDEAVQYLQCSTPATIYFGNYQTGFNDNYVESVFAKTVAVCNPHPALSGVSIQPPSVEVLNTAVKSTKKAKTPKRETAKPRQKKPQKPPHKV